MTFKKASRQLLPLIIAGSITAAVLLAAIPIAGHALLQSFSVVETSETRQHAEQVLRAFDADLGQLAISNRDYAEWDDAEKYVRTKNPEFISANFSKDSLNGMHVDLVRITRADGTELYSGFLDRHRQEYQSPAPRELIRDTALSSLASPRLTALAPTSRIIHARGGLMALAVIEIKRSDKTNATGVHMLFGRLLEADELNRVHVTSQLPVRMVPLQRGQPPADAHIPSSIVAWVQSSPAPLSIAQQVVGDNRIDAYALLRTADNEPAALLSTSSTRDVYALGSRTTWSLLGSNFALVSTFLVVFALLIWRLQRSLTAHQVVDARYRNVAAQMRETIILISTHDFRMFDGNRAVEIASGHSPQALLNLTAMDLFPDLEQQALIGLAAPGSVPVVCQSRLLRADIGRI